MSSEVNVNSGGMYGTSPRKPLTALLLSVCPGLGQHYAGHLKRGILFYITLIVASWLAAIAFMSIQSKLSIIFLCVPFVGVGLIALDAWACARRQPRDYRLQWFNRPWIYAVVFTALLFTVNPLLDFLVGQKVVRAFFMNSISMSPTILDSDIVLVNKLAFPKRGEIALIKFGKSKPSAKLTELIDDQLIKRIIAIPGDTLEIRNDVVWVNGQKIDDPYAHFKGVLRFNSAQRSSFGPKLIPSGSYFVMGDNRNESIDSRILGFIREDQIGGTATKVFWSWNFDEGGIRWERTAKSLK
ncbi:MAG: signal peptidase I [Sulfurimicrobium sp.]|nr:signal peptidase I [Sulfurimicrobium sp.]